jgi:hypothetical protein
MWLVTIVVPGTPVRAADRVDDGSVAHAALLEAARDAASAVPPRLLAALQQEIADSGFDGAIGACRDLAPRLAAQASAESGWSIRRVSLKPRNPRAAPDAWERSVLDDFARRNAAGESAASLERDEVVEAGADREFRYMKALPTQELCLGCHGAGEQIGAAVRERLAELYPDDRATGYRAGDIRGALSLRRTLPGG